MSGTAVGSVVNFGVLNARRGVRLRCWGFNVEKVVKGGFGAFFDMLENLVLLSRSGYVMSPSKRILCLSCPLLWCSYLGWYFPSTLLDTVALLLEQLVYRADFVLNNVAEFA